MPVKTNMENVTVHVFHVLYTNNFVCAQFLIFWSLFEDLETFKGESAYFYP